MKYIISKGWPDGEWTELSTSLDLDDWLESLDELILVEEGKRGFDYRLTVMDGPLDLVFEADYMALEDMRADRANIELEVEEYVPDLLLTQQNYREDLQTKADIEADNA